MAAIPVALGGPVLGIGLQRVIGSEDLGDRRDIAQVDEEEWGPSVVFAPLPCVHAQTGSTLGCCAPHRVSVVRYSVCAMDAAGNAQSRVGSAGGGELLVNDRNEEGT